jgi:hypothetical protein
MAIQFSDTALEARFRDSRSAAVLGQDWLVFTLLVLIGVSALPATPWLAAITPFKQPSSPDVSLGPVQDSSGSGAAVPPMLVGIPVRTGGLHSWRLDPCYAERTAAAG